MRRPKRVIAIAFAVVFCVSTSLLLADEPTPVEANTPLTSVSKRESYVFASSPAGLFRASLKTKRWERLKTPPEMPANGDFAAQPTRSPVLIYVVLRSQLDQTPRRPGARYGLYFSRDDGATWELVSERDDFGSVLLHPSGALFAVTGADGINSGSQLLRSSDMGKTWRDITGNAKGQFEGLKVDPDHPGLVYIHARDAIRPFLLVADDEDYHWKVVRYGIPREGKRPSDEFFSRSASSSTTFYTFPATLSNYFRYDFWNGTDGQALEVVPPKSRFEFARGARLVIPIRVVFHFDPDVLWPPLQEAKAEGRPLPKLPPPRIKFADQPDGTDFWELRVESSEGQIVKPSSNRGMITSSGVATPDGKVVSKTDQAPRVKYRVVDLSPFSPYQRDLDLRRFFSFSKPGEYRVQIVYESGGHPDREKGEWDGSFTSPVFTVIIRE